MNVELTVATTVALEVAIATRVSEFLSVLSAEIDAVWDLEQAGAPDAGRLRGTLEEAQDQLRLLSRDINSPASSPASSRAGSTVADDDFFGDSDNDDSDGEHFDSDTPSLTL